MSGEERARPLDVIAAEKRRSDWGLAKAEALWAASFAKLGLPVQGKALLDFGSSWGYFGQYLLDKRALGRYTGVDIKPEWERPGVSDWWKGDERVRLLCGDLRELTALEDEQFDIIFSYGTFFSIEPEASRRYLRWFQEHLAPAGYVVICTHHFLSWSAGGLIRDVSIPAPHYLFSREVLDRFLERRGYYVLSSPRAGLTTMTSYLAMVADVGLRVEEIHPSRNRLSEALWEVAGDKLASYPESQLGVSVICASCSQGDSEETALRRLVSAVEEWQGKDTGGSPAKPSNVWEEWLGQRVPLHGEHLAVVGLHGSTTEGVVAPKLNGKERVIELDALAHGGELAEGSVTSIVLDGGLEALEPVTAEAALTHLYQGLEEGGRLYLAIEPWTGPNGAGFGDAIPVPGAHLVVGRDTLRRYAQEKYGDEYAIPYRACLAPSSYLAMVQRVGFEVLEQRWIRTERFERMIDHFKEELGQFPVDDMAERLELLLVRPWERESFGA